MTFLTPQQALIGKLADSAPSGKIGRTALMKLCYLLQEVKGVPLGYRFTLYSYGPFDKAVLEDLGQAETLGAIKEECVLYGIGYGYEIQSQVNEADLPVESKTFLANHAEAISWVVNNFAAKPAGELELLATIVYADHESANEGATNTVDSLAQAVHGIKPKFGLGHIGGGIAGLRGMGILHSLA